MGFPKISGTSLGVSIIRATIFWGLYWGPLDKGDYDTKFRASGSGPEFKVYGFGLRA